MKLVTKAALASLALAAPAQAADLFGTAAPASFPESEAPTTVEIGSNWYLRGDLGVSFDDGPTVSLSPIGAPPLGAPGQPIPVAIGPNAHTTDFDGTLGFGYRFSDYLRLDATWDYRTGPGANRSATVVCPYDLYPEYDAITLLPLGYLYNTHDTCDGVMTVKQHTNTFLANAYVDLGNWRGFTPYLGGGLGVSVTSMSGGVNYYQTSNGYPYAADLTATAGGYPLLWVDAYGRTLAPQPAISFARQNWNRTIDSTTTGLAWALMAGFSYQLTPSVAIDVGYRYLNAGSTKTLLNAQTGTTLKQSNVSQQIRVGVRYLIQ
jgi:opacity protein-like surface antigen